MTRERPTRHTGRRNRPPRIVRAPLDRAAPFSPQPLKVAPRALAGRGRGLVAVAPLERGELIDRAPTVDLPPGDVAALEATAVGDFYFGHPADETRGVIVLGLPSLCNHAETPSADLRWRHDPALGWLAELVAIREIEAGEEVTYRYRCELWF
jgi:hypothetical protein